MKKQVFGKLVENWFAIRIGKRPKNFPYFAVDHRNEFATTPALFSTANAAERYRSVYNIEGVVVLVSISECNQVYKKIRPTP